MFLITPKSYHRTYSAVLTFSVSLRIGEKYSDSEPQKESVTLTIIHKPPFIPNRLLPVAAGPHDRRYPVSCSVSLKDQMALSVFAKQTQPSSYGGLECNPIGLPLDPAPAHFPQTIWATNTRRDYHVFAQYITCILQV